MQTQNAELKKVTRRKITTDIVKMKVGETVRGKYIGTTTGPYIDRATGEESELTRVFFERPDGSKFLLFQDGGLRNALANAMVSEGDLIEIEKLEKVSIGNGRTANNYDIYQITE